MLNLNWEKIHSIILFVTCHGLRNFPLLIHIPLYPFMNCWNPTNYYFLSLSFDLPHPFMTHPPHPTLHDTPHPTPPYPTHPFMTHPPHPTLSWPTHPTPPFMTHPTPPLYDTPHPTPLVKCNHKIRVQEHYGGRAMSCPWHGGWRHWGPLLVDMQPYGCFILSVTCHGLRNFPHSYTSPQNHLWIFETLRVV